MQNFFRFCSIAVISFSGSFGLCSTSQAQHVELSAGRGYLTFFYDSNDDRMDIVFREAGNAVTSGLSSPYGDPPGGVGGSNNDYWFSSLLIDLNFAPQYQFNGQSYYLTPLRDGAIVDSRKPSLGINTRLREGDSEIDQFDFLRWTLDVSESSIPEGASVIVFLPSGSGLAGDYDIALDTAAGELSYYFPNWNQRYWHWGFSAQGDYSLVFDVKGIGGAYGEFDPLARGSFRVDFRVGNRWRGHPVRVDMTTDAGVLGPVYVGNRPWIYNFSLEHYMYIDEDSQPEGGTWIYLPDPVE
ncbi:MAG: hypothetical protein JJU20_03845 [Opitutales bacterium]|nr:hypothetical protein [Opitutales bacterium]